MTALPPLLQLAAGRKAGPARRAPLIRPLEIELHMSVAKLLREHARPEWQWTHIGHGEARDIRTATKLKQMGVQRGWPDFALIPPTGQICCLEMKRIGEKLSPDQEAFRLWCIRHCVPHVVARTFDEALVALDAWGCLTIKFPARAETGGARRARYSLQPSPSHARSGSTKKPRLIYCANPFERGTAAQFCNCRQAPGKPASRPKSFLARLAKSAGRFSLFRDFP
jgi:hypothetical protein